MWPVNWCEIFERYKKEDAINAKNTIKKWVACPLGWLIEKQNYGNPRYIEKA